MLVLFSLFFFAAIIATVAFGLALVIQKIRRKPTKVGRKCIISALVMVVCIVGICMTFEPSEQTEEPAPAASVEPTSTEPAPEDTLEPTETPEATTPPTTTPEPEDTPQPTQEPSQTPTATPTPSPEPTEEPVEEIDPVEQDKQDIEAAAREIIEEYYTNTDIDTVTVNENYGTDEDGDYILLVYLTWNVKNSVKMTNEVLAMCSEDFAARVGEQLENVQEVALFWTVPYHKETGTAVKYAYERRGEGMYETSHFILVE